MPRSRLTVPASVTVWDPGRSTPRPATVLAVLLALLLPIALAVNPPTAEAAVDEVLSPSSDENVAIDLATISVRFDEEVASPTDLTLSDGDGVVATLTAPSLVTESTGTEATPSTSTTVTYSLPGEDDLEYATEYGFNFSVEAAADGTVTDVDESFTTRSPPALEFTIVPDDGATNIDPATPTVTATFNNALATVTPLTFTASGSEDTIDVSDRSLHVDDTRVDFDTAGVLLDRATTYTLDFTVTDIHDATLTVTTTFTTEDKLTQTIVLDPDEPADLRLDEGPVIVTATTNSDLEVAFDSATTDVCTVGTPVYDADAGETVVSLQLVAVGTCEFTASQAGDGQYASFTTNTRSFEVAAVPVEPPTFLVSPATFAPGDLVTVSGTGWGFAEEISLALVAVDDGEVTPIATVSSRIDGSLNETFLAPDVKVGGHRLTAQGAATATQASAAVRVVAATTVDDDPATGTTTDTTAEATGSGDALPLTGFDRVAPFAFLGALLALVGMLVVTRAGRSPWADVAFVEDPSGWGRLRRHDADDAPTSAAASSSASSQRVHLRAAAAGAAPVTDPETDATGDGRRYLTAGDVERLAADGHHELVVDVDTTLTDQALAKVASMGLSVVRSDTVSQAPQEPQEPQEPQAPQAATDADDGPVPTPRAELFARLRRRRG